MRFLNYILALLLTLVSSGITQDRSKQATTRVEAEVIEFLEMITLADIDVGTVIPSEDILRLDPRTDSGAGIIKVQGRPNSNIQVSFSNKIEMINLATNRTLSVTYRVSGNRENDQSASDIFLTNPENVVLNSMGEYFLWIGCEFSMADLVSGQYDGDFVIDVDYN